MDRLSVLVARLHWWWSEGRTEGKLISERLNRRLVLVGKVMPVLRRRMNKWMVQRMGWSLDVRILNQMREYDVEDDSVEGEVDVEDDDVEDDG